MITATYDDVTRLFPGIQDHTVIEILAIDVTVSDLEAASLLLGNQDDGLIEAKPDSGDQLSRVLSLLAKAEIMPTDDSDR